MRVDLLCDAGVIMETYVFGIDVSENGDSVARFPARYECHWSIYVVFVVDIEACDVLAVADCRVAR